MVGTQQQLRHALVCIEGSGSVYCAWVALLPPGRIFQRTTVRNDHGDIVGAPGPESGIDQCLGDCGYLLCRTQDLCNGFVLDGTVQSVRT